MYNFQSQQSSLTLNQKNQQYSNLLQHPSKKIKQQWATHATANPTSHANNTKYLNLIIPFQITHLQFRKHSDQPFSKRITFSDRFRHEVQKLKIDGNNMYKLILPVQGQRSSVKIIESKIMFSYADMGMSPQYQFIIDDMVKFPIIDVFEPQLKEQSQQQNAQIYHKITTSSQEKRLMKYYNFPSFTSYAFKSALYELSLYKNIPNSPLKEYFILWKGETKQLVMIFDYGYVSLHDVICYRKATGYDWGEGELLLVMKMLAEQLVSLAQVDVVHRDIRPGNIVFSNLGLINGTGGTMSNDQGQPSSNLINESINGDKFYRLFNFQSSRMVDRAALLNDQDQDDVFTIKGSPVFTQGTVRDAVMKQQHKANYNPYYNDIVGLKNTLTAMVNLQPTNVGSTQNQNLKNKPKIQTLIKYMSSSQSITIEQVSNKINDLLNINPINKPDSYYSSVRTFFLKQLTICQNIETNLYFSTSKQSAFSLMPQPSGSSIDSRNLPRKQPNPTMQYIESLYIKTLYDLHKKDTFVSYMLEKLSKNFESNRKQQNVALLIKVGEYFQQSGVRQNEYYKQAILLLTELAEQQRISGFYKDHQRFIIQAQQLYSKFAPQSKVISRAKCMYLKEKAYKQMLLESEYDFAKQIIKGLFPINHLEVAQKIIFQAYDQTQKANLPIQEQLELIYAKGELSMYMNKVEEGETFFFNGYQIAEKNYKEFLTAHNCSKYKGMFEYALGIVEMVKLRVGLRERTPKVVFEIEQKLQKAKERFSSVKIHLVYVIRCYIGLGDLAYLREDGPGACKNYQRALNLLHAQNQSRIQQNPQTGRAISARVQVQIVSKLIDTLNKTNNEIQAKKYQQLHQSLKKQFNLARKSQSGYSRKGKSRGKKDKELNKQENNLNNNLAPIQQVEEENKMFESKFRREQDQANEREVQMRREERMSEKDDDDGHVSEF